MPGSIHRNRVVRHFGTPDVAEGSVNEPREREEHGHRFNEKWIYKHPPRDPSGAAERVILWRRYDFVASMIRRTPNGELVPDEELGERLGGS